MAMTLDEALSEAVCGARVRATNMQEGSYIDYNFNGWRINFEGGSSSGWTPRDIDRESEWVEVPIEAPKPAPAKGAWANFTPSTPPGEYEATLKVDRKGRIQPDKVRPIVADVIELPGVVSREQAQAVAAHRQPWAPKKLDPNKGGW
jgi:hypothetical protein